MQTRNRSKRANSNPPEQKQPQREHDTLCFICREQRRDTSSALGIECTTCTAFAHVNCLLDRAEARGLQLENYRAYFPVCMYPEGHRMDDTTPIQFEQVSHSLSFATTWGFTNVLKAWWQMRAHHFFYTLNWLIIACMLLVPPRMLIWPLGGLLAMVLAAESFPIMRVQRWKWDPFVWSFLLGIYVFLTEFFTWMGPDWIMPLPHILLGCSSVLAVNSIELSFFHGHPMDLYGMLLNTLYLWLPAIRPLVLVCLCGLQAYMLVLTMCTTLYTFITVRKRKLRATLEYAPGKEVLRDLT